MIYITRTCTAGNEIVRCVSVESNILNALSKWQNSLVLHQHHTLGSTLTCNGSVSLEVGLVRILITLETWTLLNKVQNTLNIAIQVGLGQFAALHASYDTVELLGLTRLQHVVAGPHLLGTILTAKPVGHHGSLVAPLIAQDSGNKVLALGCVNAVDVVV